MKWYLVWCHELGVRMADGLWLVACDHADAACIWAWHEDANSDYWIASRGYTHVYVREDDDPPKELKITMQPVDNYCACVV